LYATEWQTVNTEVKPKTIIVRLVKGQLATSSGQTKRMAMDTALKLVGQPYDPTLDDAPASIFSHRQPRTFDERLLQEQFERVPAVYSVSSVGEFLNHPCSPAIDKMLQLLSGTQRRHGIAFIMDTTPSLFTPAQYAEMPHDARVRRQHWIIISLHVDAKTQSVYAEVRDPTQLKQQLPTPTYMRWAAKLQLWATQRLTVVQEDVEEKVSYVKRKRRKTSRRLR
jgi:hypothetical protein